MGAAPVLQQILDSRSVAFGCVDVRNDMLVEDLQTPVGLNAVLVSKSIAEKAHNAGETFTTLCYIALCFL